MTRESTADIVTAVRSGGRSAESVVTAALARAATANDEFNAFTAIDPAGATRRAAEIDDAIAAGRDPGPLAGVPIAIKDLIDHEGHVTTCGSSFYRHHATTTATAISRLEAAGAIVIGRTGLHEFAFGFSSENDWFGPVRNPLDRTTSPGGSSGGSAAAVAAGVVSIAIGTDTGGSVRVPAAMCGVAGLKVTHGRVPLTGVFPLAPSLDTVGPIGATVDDLARALAVMAGDDPKDPWSAPRPIQSMKEEPLGGLRIAVPRPWVGADIDEDVAVAFEHALVRLRGAGAVVRDIDAPDVGTSEHVGTAACFEIAEVHRTWYNEDPSRYGPEVRRRLADCLDRDPHLAPAAMQWRAGLRHAFERLFVDNDVVVTPTTGLMAKTIGIDVVQLPGGPVHYRALLSMFTSPVNQAGLPALSLPIAAPHGGVAGLQVIGGPWDDVRLLGIGTAMEGTVGFQSS